MVDECIYSKKEVCDFLGISTFTLEAWYRWERKEIQNECVWDYYLPQPLQIQNKRGKSLRWSLAMVEQLQNYQSKIIRGRNGVYGKYTNVACH